MHHLSPLPEAWTGITHHSRGISGLSVSVLRVLSNLNHHAHRLVRSPPSNSFEFPILREPYSPALRSITALAADTEVLLTPTPSRSSVLRCDDLPGHMLICLPSATLFEPNVIYSHVGRLSPLGSFLLISTTQFHATLGNYSSLPSPALHARTTFLQEQSGAVGPAFHSRLALPVSRSLYTQ